MNKSILGLICLLLAAHALGSNDDKQRFNRTPLQKSLNALMTNQPTLAWWELISALGQDEVAVEHWLPLKEAILKESNCG